MKTSHNLAKVSKSYRLIKVCLGRAPQKHHESSDNFWYMNDMHQYLKAKILVKEIKRIIEELFKK